MIVLYCFYLFQNGTKQILNRLNSSGHDIQAIFVCGGLSKNAVFIQCHADVTGKINHLIRCSFLNIEVLVRSNYGRPHKRCFSF